MKKKEEIKKIKKQLASFTSEHILPTDVKEDLNKTHARAKEDFTETEKTTEIRPDTEIEKIKKLKCDYQLFKDERQKNKMFVPANCEICNKPFKNNENVYCAITKQNNELFICKNCAEK